MRTNPMSRRAASERGAGTERSLLVIAMVLLLTATAATADTLEKGDAELSLDMTYLRVDRDDRSDDDQEARVSLRYGRMLSDRHEIGGELLYSKENRFDGFGLGVFYHHNFSAGDNLNPFLGVSFAVLEGDLGDIYQSAYGLSGGVKVYPFEHAGFAIGTRYHWLQGAGSSADAKQASLVASVRIKF